MNFFTFTKLGRVMLLAMVVGSVCLLGCGGSKDSTSGKSESSAAASGKSSKLTDSRDGQKYRTVNIGNQTWMAENLRYKLGDSWCYGNDESKCTQYGRLYNWEEAKIACPKGWHLPSKKEWAELVTVVGSETGGKKLKSTSGWEENGNGTDEFGFSALPVGGRASNGNFGDVGLVGYWWAATECWGGSAFAYVRGMHYNEDTVGEYDIFNKSFGFSVRCIAD